ncbi:MAG: GNAT family N-acetyltransferase [Myxococcales bacterium]|nr:GNAT family N-acetyltransferase [Myxococcales bacterium]
MQSFRAPATFGVANIDEHEPLAEILASAFAFDANVAKPWFDLTGADNLRVLRTDAGVVGGLMHIPMGWWQGGRSVPVTGIAAVGVRLDARRKGYALEMMAESLQEQHDAGVALSALYASTYALYQSVGYDVAASRHLAVIDPRFIPTGGRKGQVELLTQEHRPEIEATYHAFHAGGGGADGALDRGPYIWERLVGERRGRPAQGLLVRDDGGQLVGWVTYRTEGGLDRHVVQVQDLFATASFAVRRVWAALADMAAMASEVRFPTAMPDPFLLALPQPRFDIRFQEYALLRVVHLANAVAARGYRDGVDGQVCVAVTDDVLPDNAGAWTIEVQSGQGRATRGGTPMVRLDACALASVFAGYVHPRALAQAGRGVAGDDGGLELLGRMMAGRGNWMREMF